MTHARTLSTGRPRGPSVRGVASPSPAASRAESPSKPAVGRAHAAPTPLNTSNLRNRPGPPSPTKRTTLAPAAPLSSRTPLTKTRMSAGESGFPTPSVPKSRQSEPSRAESLLSISPSPSQRSSRQTSSPVSPPIPNTPLLNLPPISSSINEAAAEAAAAQAKKLVSTEYLCLL